MARSVRSLFLLSLCVVGILSVAPSQTPARVTPDTARMEQIVRDAVARQHFMGAVLVARDGTPMLDKGYGSADLEWQIANAPDTRFRLGSLTKQFTAASILLLEERGRLQISDPVTKYLPHAPAAWKDITLFHLLTHTSGIPNFTSFADYHEWQSEPATPEQLVARFRDKPLDFAPGEKFSYSNSGYVLLGYLIEKISGASYCDFLRKNIFAPLDMRNSGCDVNSEILPHRATGYTPSPGGLQNATYIDMSVSFAAGQLYSTTGDLLRWQQVLFGGKLLSAASLAKMTTPYKENYGFGIGITTVNGRQEFAHDGGIDGFNTRAAYYPAEKLSVIVLSNVNGPAATEIAARLAAIAHGAAVVLSEERKEVAVPASMLARYAGTYELTPAFAIVVTLAGDHLVAQATGQVAAPIYPASPTRFFYRIVDAQLEFFSDNTGRVTHLVLYQNGHELKGIRK